jgi:hypothetical protein
MDTAIVVEEWGADAGPKTLDLVKGLPVNVIEVSADWTYVSSQGTFSRSDGSWSWRPNRKRRDQAGEFCSFLFFFFFFSFFFFSLSFFFFPIRQTRLCSHQHFGDRRRCSSGYANVGTQEE